MDTYEQIERFVGPYISLDELADVDYQDLAVQMHDMWGEFTTELQDETSCESWVELAIEITDGVAIELYGDC